MVAGSQVPGTLFREVSGKAGGAEFWHNGPIVANSGIMPVAMVISMVVDTAH